ncbi:MULTISPECIES: hypothetical protein [unclassified Pseudomonas]|uniref:hypothetical protein n=1 Tax=unclassified Pseudomonas TaxID=196821 RepID=UPI002AC8F7D6|nr:MULTISPECIES: hypothetical protein [unclassified Pseudomonas]MEB0044702.1 hypothetical protein [Pseudomonas sp. Dout3]MEB0096331.1 hypothetical protein [Pseudomonas sp. DC1.2]WPX59272.1 hypothetical protein RHM68_01055 [Pseudomonas sp. DC1.2]
MTGAIKHDVETAEFFTEQEIRTFSFDIRQATLLHRFSEELAAIGGPQAPGAKSKVSLAATELKLSFSKGQCELLGAYSDGLMSVLIFEGLQKFTDVIPPTELPNLTSLENRYDTLCLAARSQILLKLVDNTAFAYDMDNEGKLVRLVANFKGGGLIKINAEQKIKELSSHSGLALGPHTEAPYWCAVNAKDGHSPSPSSLILSALWNPSLEPTRVIPLPPILDKIGATNCLALTTSNFQFTRSDSFVSGKGEDGGDVSILEFDDKVGFAARFNSYRFSVNENASIFVKQAYTDLCQSVNEATPAEYTLTQESAMAINNTRALHCRDVIKDNRRVLVRIFGLSKFSSPIVISDDPLLLQG